MNANLSTNNKFYIQECCCPAKHRFTSSEKEAGKGVVCQDDQPYHYAGMITQGESETYNHAKYRALLTKFEAVN